MLEAVIFDMDGVIVDSEPIHMKADKLLLNHYEINVSDEFLLGFIGVKSSDFFKSIVKDFNIKDELKKIVEIHGEIRNEIFCNSNLQAIPGILDLLMEIKNNNIKAAIASSSPRSFINYIVHRLELDNYFDVYVSGEDVTKGKPEPDIFIKTADILNVNVKNCVVIEDSTHGANAAGAAGMKCIGFNNITSSYKQDLSNTSVIVESITSINYKLLNSLI